jgi:uncharacterized membrane protein (GlpM family)
MNKCNFSFMELSLGLSVAIAIWKVRAQLLLSCYI